MKVNLLGPYRLTIDGIDGAETRSKPGVFALGHQDFNGRFLINHVGRDDKDLRETLRRSIGSNAFFKYAEVETSQEAFEKECELFHKFKPPGNVLHPDRPAGTDWMCPHCLRYRGGW